MQYRKEMAMPIQWQHNKYQSLLAKIRDYEKGILGDRR